MLRVVRNFFYSGFAFLAIILLFFAITFPLVRKQRTFLNQHQKKYNVVSSLKYGHLDLGFNQQAVEGICLGLDIPLNKCNGKNPLIAQGKATYGHPYTMDNIAKIKNYVDYFAETEKINHFILPGYTYTGFLKKWLFDNRHYFANQGINFIAIGTSLADKN